MKSDLMYYTNLDSFEKKETIQVFIFELEKIDKRLSLNKETILETKDYLNSSQVENCITAENIILNNTKNFILSQIYEILCLIFSTYSIDNIKISDNYKKIYFICNYQLEEYIIYQ